MECMCHLRFCCAHVWSSRKVAGTSARVKLGWGVNPLSPKKCVDTVAAFACGSESNQTHQLWISNVDPKGRPWALELLPRLWGNGDLWFGQVRISHSLIVARVPLCSICSTWDWFVLMELFGRPGFSLELYGLTLHRATQPKNQHRTWHIKWYLKAQSQPFSTENTMGWAISKCSQLGATVSSHQLGWTAFLELHQLPGTKVAPPQCLETTHSIWPMCRWVGIGRYRADLGKAHSWPVYGVAGLPIMYV